MLMWMGRLQSTGATLGSRTWREIADDSSKPEYRAVRAKDAMRLAVLAICCRCKLVGMVLDRLLLCNLWLGSDNELSNRANMLPYCLTRACRVDQLSLNIELID